MLTGGTGVARSAGAKENRHKLLQEKLEAQPYLTDEELAALFHVSVPTIRLDRMPLGIQSLQGRLKQIAATGAEQLRTAEQQAGMLVDIEKGYGAYLLWKPVRRCASQEQRLFREAIFI
jgi:hypothetical protein